MLYRSDYRNTWYAYKKIKNFGAQIKKSKRYSETNGNQEEQWIKSRWKLKKSNNAVHINNSQQFVSFAKVEINMSNDF